MAKETTSGTGFKTPQRFNEQVNAILLIMFLSVVIILSLKGCGNCMFTQKENENAVQEESVVKSDSLTNDSILNIN